MVAIQAAQQVKPGSQDSSRISFFLRGSEIVTYKLFKRIGSDPKRLWHVSDFKDIASEIVIKRRLKELEKMSVVVRLKTYPRFCKLKPQNLP